MDQEQPGFDKVLLDELVSITNRRSSSISDEDEKRSLERVWSDAYKDARRKLLAARRRPRGAADGQAEASRQLAPSISVPAAAHQPSEEIKGAGAVDGQATIDMSAAAIEAGEQADAAGPGSPAAASQVAAEDGRQDFFAEIDERAKDEAKKRREREKDRRKREREKQRPPQDHPQPAQSQNAGAAAEQPLDASTTRTQTTAQRVLERFKGAMWATAQRVPVVLRRRAAIAAAGDQRNGPAANDLASVEAQQKAIANARAKARDMELLGLALSGGGIRSASFCLGVLQGLADLGLIKRLDYLSTVSGGGYIGGWLAGWIRREKEGVKRVEQQMRTSRVRQAEGRDRIKQPIPEESDAISHLRAYSSFLVPRLSLTSGDSWAIVATYVRNTSLNLLVILPALLALLLLPRFLLLFYAGYTGNLSDERVVAIVIAALAVLCAWAGISLRRGIDLLDHQDPDATGRSASEPAGWRERLRSRLYRRCNPDLTRAPLTENGLVVNIVVPLLVASFLAGWLNLIRTHGTKPSIGSMQGPAQLLVASAGAACQWPADLLVGSGGYMHSAVLFGIPAVVLFTLPFALALLFDLGCAFIASRWPEAAPQKNSTPSSFNTLFSSWKQRRILDRLAATAVAALVGGALWGVLQRTMENLAFFKPKLLSDQLNTAAVALAAGPPVMVAIFALGLFIYAAMLAARRPRATLPSEMASRCLNVPSFADEPAPSSVEQTAQPPQTAISPDQRADAEREWWASVAGYLLKCAVCLGGGIGLALFSIPLLNFLGLRLQYALTSGWVLTTAGGLLAGKSSATGRSSQRGMLDLLARIAPYVFLLGLAVCLSCVLVRLVDTRVDHQAVEDNTPKSVAKPSATTLTDKETRTGSNRVRTVTATATSVYSTNARAIANKEYWYGLVNASDPGEKHLPTYYSWRSLLPRWCAWFLALSLIAWAASYCVGVDTFSLHRMYANRLVRCFLGASREREPAIAPTNVQPPRRMPNPLTGFDPLDDVPLEDLCVPRGPYLLVNTALNLVEDADLAWQERKAASFLFSPFYCGGKITGYRKTDEYQRPIRLGSVMSISGAAVSPNMGYHSSPAVTALLTLFNVRLGAWLGNPKHTTKWSYSEPRHALPLLFSELFGRTNRESPYVYLSDGGHFENLGAYELVSRHCRYVIVADADCDPTYEFADLGGLIRKCAIDLGVPIEIDVTSIRPQPDGYCPWHCAIGHIRYDVLDPTAIPGTLVYIKTSLTGDEPTDVLNYARQHSTFPHQTTANQFFTESQFESYRRLGQHVADMVFSRAMRGAELCAGSGREIVRLLFSHLIREWFPPPPELEKNYIEASKAWLELASALRDDPLLRQFSLSLYPELAEQLASASGDRSGGAAESVLPADRERAEFHATAQMLEIMEMAFLSVHLEGFHAHPMNRGWMNAFRRWAASDIVRRHWLALRGEFSQDFVRFCEDELSLDVGSPMRYLIEGIPGIRSSQQWLAMSREFINEWPGEKTFDELLPACLKLEMTGNQPAAWLIGVAPNSNPHLATCDNAKFPCGVVMIWPDNEVPGACRLLVWIRGAYRNLQIGREVFDGDFVDQLRDELVKNYTQVRVVFPDANRPGSPYRSQKAIWLSFFYEYGFRREDRDANGQVLVSDDLVLVRDLVPPPASPAAPASPAPPETASAVKQ